MEAAREACTALRWHPALRRKAAQARAESVVRAGRASAELDGARLPLRQMRELVGADSFGAADPADVAGRVRADRPLSPLERTALGALRVSAAAGDLGAVVASAPLQALAKLHLAAVAQTQGRTEAHSGDVGRPRPTGVGPGDLHGLGPALSGPPLAERLDALAWLLVAPTEAPALIVAAVVHGELLTLRPFTSGNGLVARAAARAVIIGRGLDPTAVAVPEVGLLARGQVAYVGMAAGYASGTPEGVGAWLGFVAEAVVAGAQEGERVAAAVLAGRSEPT